MKDVNSVKMLFRHDNQTKATEDSAADIRLSTINANDFLMWHYLNLLTNILYSIFLRVILTYHCSLLILEN